jgi:Flp pilus assembly protein TadG
MRFVYKLIRRFSRDEKGGLVVEAVLVLPVLFWALAALFSFWDAYRTINTVQKASYTISDLISRVQVNAGVDDAYVNGLRRTMDYLLDVDQAADIRVTSYRWNNTDSRYEVIWSRSPNNAMLQLTTATLESLSAKLPIMSDGETAVLVETKVNYTPILKYGLVQRELTQFIVTKPRFLPRICHVNETCPAVS